MVSLGKPQFHTNSCCVHNICSISGSPLQKEEFLLFRRLMFLVCVCVYGDLPKKGISGGCCCCFLLDAVLTAAGVVADCNFRRVTGTIKWKSKFYYAVQNQLCRCFSGVNPHLRPFYVHCPTHLVSQLKLQRLNLVQILFIPSTKHSTCFRQLRHI
jgi:hypothetical protein